MDWQTPAEVSPELVRRLSTELSLHPVCAEILVRRGLETPQLAAAFLRDSLKDLPDPFLMKGMAAATARVVAAIRGRERIILYGDYDVDGASSTALMLGVLKELGAAAEFYIPHRLTEGYGLNTAAVDRIAAGGQGLIITLDCGVTAVSEVEHAVARGMGVVVVDHHTTPVVLPPAEAILNPHQPGCDYPSKNLCAAGVAFNLLMGVRKVLRDQGFFASRTEPNLGRYLDLVALATIADVVPLTGANRVLVRRGLDLLSKAERPGIRALKRVAGLVDDQRVTAGQVGFRLAPRINAAGRLDQAARAVALLTTSDADEAEKIAKDLDVQNRERQAIEQQILTEAMIEGQRQVDAGALGLVLASRGWHAGVVGIVAARVVERLHRPTVVIAIGDDGMGKGSARSIEGFHLYDALLASSESLVKFGGHKHAAGVTVREERVPEFTQAFEARARSLLDPSRLGARIRVDAALDLGLVDLPLVEAIERLGPFGAGHPEPVFFAASDAREVRVLPSKRAGDSHLKLRLTGSRGDLPAIGFGLGALSEVCRERFQAAFQLDIDDYGGNRRPSLRLKHVRAHP